MVATWTLILLSYAGAFAKGDNVTLATVPGFTSKATCSAAGNAAKAITSGTQKDTNFVCVEVK